MAGKSEATERTEATEGSKRVERRAVAGFVAYRVDRMGNVWTCLRRRGWKWCRTGKWKRLKPFADRCGYLMVNLRSGGPYGRSKYKLVHHLVLEAFGPPRKPGQQCRHLNGVKTDNHAENLVWGSRAENAADRIRHGTTSFKLKEADVREIRRLRQEEGMTYAAIADRFKVAQSLVWRIVNGLLWSHCA